MMLMFTFFTFLVLMMQVSSKNVTHVEHAVDTDIVIRLPEFTQVRFVHRPDYKNFSRVLFWTPAYASFETWFFWFDEKYRTETCPDLPCHFTTDRKFLNDSDAVVFMVFGKTMDLDMDLRPQIPPHRLPHQRYVYYSSESPRVNMTKFNGFFNWTMTYRRDSDVYAHFGRLVLNRLPDGAREVDEHRDYATGKTKMAVWFVSHCKTSGRREHYVERLKKRLPVDIYGSCGNLRCNRFKSDCLKVIADYKFYLSFENTLCKDYVSEKLMKGLVSEAVPIVFGGADYSLYAPAGSYINTKDFASPEALADYLLFLDANPAEYNRFFDWKRGYSVKVLRHQLFTCELCAKLLQDVSGTQVAKTYDDFEQWWTEEGNCSQWEG